MSLWALLHPLTAEILTAIFSHKILQIISKQKIINSKQMEIYFLYGIVWYCDMTYATNKTEQAENPSLL